MSNPRTRHGGAPVSAGDLVSTARRVAREELRRWAPVIDAENRFAREGTEALRREGLLSYFIPPAFGGVGGDVETYSTIAAALAEECLATALIWVMHAHQTAILVDHTVADREQVLRQIARDGTLVASITSERGKGGDVLRADAPLEPAGDRLRLRRSAPVVSYGAHAGFFLVTMRVGADRPANDACLVLVRPADGVTRVSGEWDAMGMRGTASVPMELDVVVDQDRVVGASYRAVILQTMVPLAQTGWAAAWYGAARGAYDRFIRHRRATAAEELQSDRFVERLARLRLSLDTVESLLLRVARRLDEMRATEAPAAAYEEIPHNILVNNLKIAAAEECYAVVDGLVELGGMGYGYTRHEDGLDRVLRDLRSASLMYSNDRLILANGRMALVDSVISEAN